MFSKQIVCISYNMTSKNKNRQFGRIFSPLTQMLKESKLKLIIFGVICFIALLTGIIVAIKTCHSLENLENYNLLDFGFGFWGRLLSMLFVALICFGCSFLPWLFPVAIIFLAYRAYLLGVSLAWIIICNNFMGVVFSLFVILPCQLLVLGIIIIMYVLLCKARRECAGKGDFKKRATILILALLFLVAICIVESLLFVIFSPSVILVI